MKDFREFLLRGNLVDMAVGIMVGVAFAAVVTALVADLITPLIAAIGGQTDFSQLKFEVNGSRFLYGAFLNALITFLVLAAVVFFLVVKPVNTLTRRYKTQPPIDATVRQCPHCLSEIPAAAGRCAFCTQEVGSAPATTI